MSNRKILVQPASGWFGRPLAALLVLICVSAAPSSAASSAVRVSRLNPQPVADGFLKIGPVATNLWTFNALDVYDPKLKTDVFYITSFNSAGLGQLIRLDYRRDRATAWTLPVGIGSWGIIQGRDGNLYLGSYNGGELLCFDPRTEKWLPLPQAPAAFRKQEFIVCDLAQAPNGDIYYGTYPGCHLVCYDPRTRTVTDLGRAADENYLRNVAVTPDGIVLCGVGTRHSRIVAYNPKTGRFSEIEPPQYQNSGVSTRPLVGKNLIAQPGASAVLVYDARTLKLLHVFPLRQASGFNLLDGGRLLYQEDSGPVEVMDLRTGAKHTYCAIPGRVADGRWYVARDGNLLGLRVQSYVYVNVKNRRTERRRIPVDGLGQEVLWLRSAPGGLIYGGPGLGQTMFSYNPATHALRSYDQVIDQGGEIYYGIPYRGKIYTISYVEATLAVFDPARPWDQGDSAGSNPRTLLRIPQQQYRPLGGLHAGPGGKLYIGTQPDYGLLGGALSAYDPATGKLQVHRNVVPNEEISAVAADDRFVYCGADPGGGGGSRPTARRAHFFVWDPGAQRIVFDRAFPGGHGFGAIAAAKGHAYFVTGAQLMDYNRATRTLASIYTFAKPRPVPLESLQAARDGTLWGILGRELAHISPSARRVTFFPETAGKATSGLTIGAGGSIYFGSGTDVWIYHPKSPSPSARFDE
ncbi:MAG: hypothetical protein ACRD1N_02615 [Terriglobia bacterium]